jgi:hypothetical protein
VTTRDALDQAFADVRAAIQMIEAGQTPEWQRPAPTRLTFDARSPYADAARLAVAAMILLERATAMIVAVEETDPGNEWEDRTHNSADDCIDTCEWHLRGRWA